jgi:hypothetical protein
MDYDASNGHYIKINNRDIIGYSGQIYISPDPIKLGNDFLGAAWKILGLSIKNNSEKEEKMIFPKGQRICDSYLFRKVYYTVIKEIKK